MVLRTILNQREITIVAKTIYSVSAVNNTKSNKTVEHKVKVSVCILALTLIAHQPINEALY